MKYKAEKRPFIFNLTSCYHHKYKREETEETEKTYWSADLLPTQGTKLQKHNKGYYQNSTL